MRVSHGRTGAQSLHQRENFTGDVWADPVVTDILGATMHHVFFAPRARTFWHTHETGQLLCITSGSGKVFSRSTGGVVVRPGDIVWIEPGEVHWHGASDDSFLVHTAVSLGSHEWMEPVSDEDYAAV
jgi:quercetin dioxygenase-like cupin family protein